MSASPDGSRAWAELPTYHGQAVIKQPVWTWEIPIYFFTGGVAGASAGLAYLAELRGNEVLGRRAWAIALGAVTISPALLTSDLGKPARFLNMLRMFKITSPMSVGSWVLSASGATTAVAAADRWLGLFPRSGRLCRPLAALLGLPLSTYTAALISNTAVPAWHQARRELPFLFGSGAALSAGSAALIATPPQHARPARRLALAAGAAELATSELMKKRLGGHGEVYKAGVPARLSRVAQACILAGGALAATRGSQSRVAAAAAGTLMGAGALAARWSVFRAGFASASDPKYVVGPQRSRIERGERRGAARREPRISDPDAKLGTPASALR